MLSLEKLHADFRAQPRVKVFVPFLAYDWRGDVQTFFSFIDTLATAHVELVPPIANFQDGVARSRNAVTYHFRHKTDAEFIFFMALDTKFTAADFERVLAKMQRYNLDVCAGMYAGKGAKLKWIFTVFDTKDKPDPETGLLHAKQVGTDFLCIRRRVFDKIEADKPELRYNFNPAPGINDPHVNFFGMPVHEGELESEDWNFSRLARESGFKCHVDTQTVALHRGNIYFPLFLSLTPEEIFEIVHHRFKFDLRAALDPTKAPVPQMPAIKAGT
jgi:hypothetical protein